MESVYLAGSYHDWRDSVINKKRNTKRSFKYVNPKNHRQNSMAKLVVDDMSASMKSDRTLVYLPKGKSSPTMTFAEVGAAYIAGKEIIVVNENKDENFITKYANIIFRNLDDAIGHIESSQPLKFHSNNKYYHEDRLNICYSGIYDLEIENETIFPFDFNIDRFGDKVDMLVVQFPRGQRDKTAVGLMGVAYALDIPIIMCTDNPLIYPPLGAMARRIFTGEQNQEILQNYLNNLTSLDVASEAKVMYDLFDKYNS